MQECGKLSEIRFQLDDPRLYRMTMAASTAPTHSSARRFALRHVRISESLVPSVYRSIHDVFVALDIEPRFTAFVSADEAINASCLATDAGPLIWLSSGLIKTLESQELRFVIGHEVGHWYLGHYRYPSHECENESDFLLRQALSRACEISADRFGLLAVRDLDVALRAMLKTASGLPSDHLGLSASEYLRQSREWAAVGENIEEVFSSHPPMVIRARALLWFSLSEPFSRLSCGEAIGDSLEIIDARIVSDLESALGGRYAEKRTEDIVHKAFWLLIERVCQDGKLSIAEQATIEDAFGTNYLDKFKAMFHGQSLATVTRQIAERADNARAGLAAYSTAEISSTLKANSPVGDLLRSRGIDLV